MKTGRSLQDLATEINRQAEAKRDFIADTRQMTVLTAERESELHLPELGEFPLSDHAHSQLAAYLEVFKRDGYDRLRRDHSVLFDHNVNTLFRELPAKRMVRTLDGRVRALLSDRYRRLDNVDLIEAIMPVLGTIPDVQFPSMEVTERKLYLKAVAPRVSGEVKVGDVVQAGVVITNSEIGDGRLQVLSMIYRLSCTNGAITGAELGRTHVGRQTGGNGDSDAWELYRDETLAADDKAFFMKVADVVRHAVSEAKFNQTLAKMQMAASSEPMQMPITSVTELAKRYNLADSERDSVLQHLLMGGDLTKWGALNAVTRAAQDVESYDRATELEQLGGDILALPASEWKVIAQAKR